MAENVNREILSFVDHQIDACREELAAYGPDGLDWVKRSRKAAEAWVPFLVSAAPGLVERVTNVLHSPARLRQAWDKLVTQHKLPANRVREINALLAEESMLLNDPPGEVISSVISEYLLKAHNGLGSNGKNDYPDLYLRNMDYSSLPVQDRTTDKAENMWAGLRNGRPVRIPDGLEIKSVKKGRGVDCHHAHIGLHLALIFQNDPSGPSALDVRIAFMRAGLYRITIPRTKATTLKASIKWSTINGPDFLSVLPVTD